MQNKFNHLTDRGWKDMSRVLDKELPVAKRRRKIAIWWWLFPLVLGAALWIFNTQSSNTVDLDEMTNAFETTIANSTQPENKSTIKEINAEKTNEEDNAAIQEHASPSNTNEIFVPSKTINEARPLIRPAANNVNDIFNAHKVDLPSDNNPSINSEPVVSNVIPSRNAQSVSSLKEISQTRSILSLLNPSPRLATHLSWAPEPIKLNLTAANNSHNDSDYFLQIYTGAETAFPSNFKGYEFGVGIGKDLGRFLSASGNVGVKRLYYSSSTKSELERAFDDELAGAGVEMPEVDIYEDLSQSDLIDNVTYLELALNIKYKLTPRFGLLLNAGASRLLSVNNLFPDDVNSVNATPLGGPSYIQNQDKYLQETHALSSTLWSMDLGIYYHLNERINVQASYGVLANKLLTSNNIPNLQLLNDNEYKYRALSVQLNYRFLNF